MHYQLSLRLRPTSVATARSARSPPPDFSLRSRTQPGTLLHPEHLLNRAMQYQQYRDLHSYAVPCVSCNNLRVLTLPTMLTVPASPPPSMDTIFSLLHLPIQPRTISHFARCNSPTGIHRKFPYTQSLSLYFITSAQYNQSDSMTRLHPTVLLIATDARIMSHADIPATR